MTAPMAAGKAVMIGGQRWTLGVKLGEGGGGAVFSARSDAGVEGAVKFVAKTGGRPRDNVIQRPMVELRNILPIWDAGEHDTWWTFVMPRGEISLERYLLQRAVPLDQAEALDIMTDIATALRELDVHDGVVHRDIKPGNVVRYQRRWQLVDFGISRLVEAATATLTKREALSRSGPTFASSTCTRRLRA
jgi:eukaryotic-like serine/threonine-protein kinase